MALSAAIQWEIRPATGGADNGGGFKAGATGTDRSQQAAAQLAIDNATITCTTPGANSNTLTFASGYTPDAADVGNVVAITAGTNINANLYEITAIDAGAKTWTVTGSTNLTTAGGAGSNIVGNMGGARSGLSNGTTALQTKLIAGQTVWIKAESGWGEAITWNANITFEGYQTTRGDSPRGANRPRNDLLGTAGSCFTTQGSSDNTKMRHLIAAGAGSHGFYEGGSTVGNTYDNCRATGCAGTGFNFAVSGNSSEHLRDCEADGNGVDGFNYLAAPAETISTHSHHNGGTGFTVGSVPPFLLECMTFANDGYGISSAASAAIVFMLIRCAAVQNGSDGLNFPGSASIHALSMILSCDFSGNGGNGITAYRTADVPLVDWNNFYDNAAAYGSGSASPHDTALDPGYADTSSVDITDLVIDASDSTKVTSVARPFTSSDVGKYLRTDKTAPGTGFRKGGWYILSVDGSNVATLDGVIGTTSSTGGVAKLWGMDFAVGANLVGKGWPTGVTGTPTVSYPDIGAVQAESVGGGGPLIGGRLVG